MTKEATAVERAVRSAHKQRQTLDFSPYNMRGDADALNRTAMPFNDPTYVRERTEVRNETWRRVMSNKLVQSNNAIYNLGKQLGVYFQHEKAKREQDKINRSEKEHLKQSRKDQGDAIRDRRRTLEKAEADRKRENYERK
jgi:hypothetical protein